LTAGVALDGAVGFSANTQKEMTMYSGEIHATLTRCRRDQPLIVLTDEPFNGLELRPDALRRMAQRLIEIADMADARPTGKKWLPKKVCLYAT
jgi:hypothetical protein